MASTALVNEDTVMNKSDLVTAFNGACRPAGKEDIEQVIWKEKYREWEEQIACALSSGQGENVSITQIVLWLRPHRVLGPQALSQLGKDGTI